MRTALQGAGHGEHPRTTSDLEAEVIRAVRALEREREGGQVRKVGRAWTVENGQGNQLRHTRCTGPRGRHLVKRTAAATSYAIQYRQRKPPRVEEEEIEPLEIDDI
jgi:integrase